YGLAGLKKTLDAYGFDVRDIVLERWLNGRPLEAAVYSAAESRLDQLEADQTRAEKNIKILEEAIKNYEEGQELWKTATLDTLTKRFAAFLGVTRVTEQVRKERLDLFASRLARYQARLTQEKQDREDTLKEKAGLNTDEAAGQRRM